MRVSELIAVLQRAQDLMGDHPVSVSVDVSTAEPETVGDRAFGDVIDIQMGPGIEICLLAENGKLNF